MSETFPRAGFFKRVFVMVYDLLAVLAIIMLITVLNFIVLSVLSHYGVFNLGEYQDHSAYLNQQWWFKLEVLAGIWLFYAWFWYDGGQTIGMRAWRLRVQATDGQPLTLKRTALRALAACLGLGNLLVLFMPRTKLALQDRLTNTEVVVLTKDANKRIYLRGIEDPNR